MKSRQSVFLQDIVFAPSLPLMLVKVYFFICVGAIALFAAARGWSIFFLVTLACVLIALVIVRRYCVGVVIVRGFDLVCRQGLIATRERSVRLANIDIEYLTQPIGFFFHCNDVIVLIHGERVVMRNICKTAILKAEIQQRQILWQRVMSVEHVVTFRELIDSMRIR
jgi:hypothetical protein